MDTRLLASGELLIRIEAIAEVEVGLLIEKSEAAQAQDSFDRTFFIDDWDWNDWYVSAHSHAGIHVEMSAIADRSTLDFQKIDVDDFETVEVY